MDFPGKTFLNSKVAKNGMWLYILQFFNTVAPLLILPYIVRVLGSAHYGVFSYSLILIGYFQVVVEYGFNLSGSRKIATEDDLDEVSNTYNTIFTCKIILCILSFLFMLIMLSFFEIDDVQLKCMVILFSMIAGTALQQTWLFQGLQDMKFITIINVIARTLSLVLIFLFIKSEEQVLLYCAFYSATFVLNGIISIIIVRKHFNIKFRVVPISRVIHELKESWYIFTTSAMTKVFSGIGITVLGMTSTHSFVGIYSTLQKVPVIVIMLFSPISQAIYPYICTNYKRSFSQGFKSVKKIGIITMVIVTILCLLIAILSKVSTLILFGQEYAIYSQLLIPLSIWAWFSILNNFLGTHTLVASGHLKEYSIAFRIGVIAILIMNFTFGVYYEMVGVAIAAVTAEIVLTIALIYQIKKVRKSFMLNN